jgi:hypothetical protein
MRRMNARSLYAGAAGVLSLLAMSLVPACGSKSNDSGFPNPGSSSGGTSSGTSSGASSSGTSSGGTGSSSGVHFQQPDGGGLANEDGGACATATAQATATSQPVYLLFILDGSGSMGDSNKWTAATAAIDGVFSDMKTKADPGIGAGLIVFSDQNDPTGASGPYPSSADVSIAFVDSTQYTKLTGRTANDQPFNDTPTGTALTGAYGEETSYTPVAPLQAGGKKVVVLITDGVPTDNCAPSGNGTDNYTQNTCVMQAASELTAASGAIETFVIGVGTLPGDFQNYDSYFLGYLAQAGGSAPAGCNPKENTNGATDLCYFNVDPSGSSTATQTAFETAINAIRGQVVSLSCTFKLDLGDAGTIDPTKVNVTVNGVTVPEDPTNGWTYDNPNDPTSVTLHGTSCTEVTSTKTATVSIVLGCATITHGVQ